MQLVNSGFKKKQSSETNYKNKVGTSKSFRIGKYNVI